MLDASIVKIKVSDENLKKYNAQRNVIKKTGASTLNYGTIKLLVDQDPDGADIACLLIQFFSKWPDLFLQGRIKRLNTPLYVARKKDDVKYFYSKDEYDAYKSKLKGWTIDYMKGLGSLSEDDYREAINNPQDTTITYDTKAEQFLSMAFGNKAELRKDWLLGN